MTDNKSNPLQFINELDDETADKIMWFLFTYSKKSNSEIEEFLGKLNYKLGCDVKELINPSCAEEDAFTSGNTFEDVDYSAEEYSTTEEPDQSEHINFYYHDKLIAIME